MLNVLIGIVSGIVSGSGMGGGTILILCLSLFMGMEQHMAQATNLVFFIPTSISAILVNLKQKIIRWDVAITICIFGMIGAVIGAIVSSKTGVGQLKKYFGIFLLIIAIFEIYKLVKEYILYKKRDNINYKEN